MGGLFVSLLLRLLLLLADADASQLELVAGHAPDAVEVLAGHLLQLENQQRHSCEYHDGIRGEGGRRQGETKRQKKFLQI